MNHIDFSIIIPCFNSASTIQRTLESIFTQDYNLKKIEVIIVDDCSTDSTTEVIQNISGFEKLGLVRVHKTKINLGPGVARNVGIEASTGRYILFLDSDDTLNSFSMKELNNVSLKGTDIILFDGQLISDKHIIICKHSKMLNASNFGKAKAILNLETDEHVIFSAYRRDFLYNLPRFGVGVYEDIEFSGWAYFQAQSIEHLSCVLVNKFQTPGQITENMTLAKAKQYLSARLDLTRKIIEFLPNHSQDLNMFFESGLRGSISVTLKKLRNHSRNLKEFDAYLQDFFEFLCSKMDKLDSIVSNHNNTDKDVNAFNFYNDWKRIRL